jgi:hypothetical protein
MTKCGSDTIMTGFVLFIEIGISVFTFITTHGHVLMPKSAQLSA